MTLARRELVSAETTPYYHLIARCVRRGFLCGFDTYSRTNYEHRRQWVVDRLAQLAEIFAIEVLAYSVMSNHYHLVVRLRPELSGGWTDSEVIDRWSKLFGVPEVLKLASRADASSAQRKAAQPIVKVRRQRLASVSWFMKCLNEQIARRANKEDECTGAFWEGRFKSRALLNKKALLSCMAYVDLNPIRAEIATTPESSNYTSVQARIRRKGPVRLAVFEDEIGLDSNSATIPAKLGDYITLVNRAARQTLSAPETPDDQLELTLAKIRMDPEQWLAAVGIHRAPFSMIGTPNEIRASAARFARKWFRGVGSIGMFQSR